MKSPRVPRIIVSIAVMFVLWLGLGFIQKIPHVGWLDSASFFIPISRVLLMAGIIISAIAAFIAFLWNRRSAAEDRPATPAGPIAAILIAALAVLIAGFGVYDTACGDRGGSGEWAGFGDIVVFVISIPGGIIALLLAIFLRSFKTTGRLVCLVLALGAIGLPFLMPPLRQARDRRRLEEIMHPAPAPKAIQEAPVTPPGK